jgi:hypothetical protein
MRLAARTFLYFLLEQKVPKIQGCAIFPRALGFRCKA